jgi:putative hydrolases of HD superfamily
MYGRGSVLCRSGPRFVRPASLVGVLAMLAIEDGVLRRQFEFLLELDRLKTIVRQTHIANRSRRENSAEHSWHLAMFALVLGEHAAQRVDVLHAVRLLLVHDIVEIDAGDAPIHSSTVHEEDLRTAEMNAAKRIFSLLPIEQGKEMEALWLEFEEAATPAARFAKALDRLQPLLLNVMTAGGTWSENAVTEQEVIERYGPTIDAGAPALWTAARRLVANHFAEREKTQ